MDIAAVLWFSIIILAVILTLKKESLSWVFFVPFLQGLYLGQLDPAFWLIYRSKRPFLWALLSLKPQFLPLILPGVLTSKRNFAEFLVAATALHLPFLLVRPSWPLEWIRFLSAYEQNRLSRVPSTTVSGEILFSAWAVPFGISLLLLLWLRRKNLQGVLFLANPLLLPYDYSLLMGSVSKVIVPLSWVALWGAWQVKAGWPYSVLLIIALLFETARERRAIHQAQPPKQ